MTKYEFLAVLSEGLKNLPQTERKEILYDYEEHFRIGESKNKSDEEIISELGDPHMILSQYKSNYDGNNFYDKNEKNTRSTYNNYDQSYQNTKDIPHINTNYNKSYRNNSNSDIVKVIITIALILAAIPLGSTVFSVLLSLYGAALFSTFAGIVLIISGLTGGLVLPIISLPLSLPLPALVFLGIGTTALGILIFMFSIWLTKYLYDLLLKLINWIKQELKY